MNKRKKNRPSLLFLKPFWAGRRWPLSLICLLGVVPLGHKVSAPVPPPNVVLIYVDDMGYGDMSINGHPTIRTPNLDNMARKGLRFTNFYSGSPACTASRYALLTGRVPARSGFAWVLNPDSEKGLHPEEWTLAEGLKSRGYKTAAYGKWHLGSTSLDYLPLQNGFDAYLGFPYSNDMIPPKWPSIPLLVDNDTLAMDPDQRGLTKRFADEAIQFIDTNKEGPFFVYLPFSMPHVPLMPGDEHAGTSARGLYGDVIEEIDAAVGAINTYLEEAGIAEQTLVWFASDNGPWLIKNEEGGSSGLFRDGKGSTWEGGMRVPGLAYWPGTIDAGRVSHEVVSVMDLYTTNLLLAGAPTPKDRIVDGKDIRPLLSGDQINEAHPLFYYGPRRLNAVRHGAWKLHFHTSSQLRLRYFEGKVPLLFNVSKDPGEQYDLAEEYPEIVSRLEALATQHLAGVTSFWDP